MKKNIKKKWALLFLPILILMLTYYFSNNGDATRPITKLADLKDLSFGKPIYTFSEKSANTEIKKLSVLPVWQGGYDPFVIELSNTDLSSMDLSNCSELYETVYYDTNTIWPSKLPEEFNPKVILELGKNPGLSIKELHTNGITGKGVNIAIIDSALLTGHEEYKENIKLYELLHCLDQEPFFHGSAVTSIAVGNNVGVAPDANVYYIASTFGTINNGVGTLDLSYVASGIMRILEINKILPDSEKIRVISISRGYSKGDNGYEEVYKAVEEAKKDGVFVITPTLEENYRIKINGLGREVYSNPDDVNLYRPGFLWDDYYYNYHSKYMNDTAYNFNMLLVPMDSRTFAACTGESDYAFIRQGGTSLACPWIAGVYALCLQVKPELLPEEFLEKAIETADIIDYKYNGNDYRLGKILNPTKLINSLSRDN